MSGCCNEPECRRKKPFHIRRGWLTGQVWLITDYTVDPHSGGERLRMKSRHDITDEIEAFMRSEGWTPPPGGDVGVVVQDGTKRERKGGL